MDGHPDPPGVIGKLRGQLADLAKRLRRRLRQNVRLACQGIDFDELGDRHVSDLPFAAGGPSGAV